MDLSIVVPAYNAATLLPDRVALLLRYLKGTGVAFEVVIVDDGSTDDTWAAIERLRDDGVVGVRLAENQGKFAAIKAGMQKATGRCRIFTDADIPYDCAVLQTMLSLVTDGGFHLVVGDRTLPDSRYAEDLGPLRKVATRSFSTIVRLLFTGELPDTQCGVKAFRGDVADVLFPMLVEDRFAGDVELLYVANKYNLAIRRVPVQLVHQGRSTLRPFVDAPQMLWSASQLRARFQRGDYESSALAAIAMGAAS